MRVTRCLRVAEQGYSIVKFTLYVNKKSTFIFQMKVLLNGVNTYFLICYSIQKLMLGDYSAVLKQFVISNNFIEIDSWGKVAQVKVCCLVT